MATTNDRSILMISNGRLRSRFNDENPVPKSSNAITTPASLSALSSSTTSGVS